MLQKPEGNSAFGASVLSRLFGKRTLVELSSIGRTYFDLIASFAGDKILHHIEDVDRTLLGQSTTTIRSSSHTTASMHSLFVLALLLALAAPCTP